MQRADDRAEAVRERLAIYRRSRFPVMEYYRRRGLLRTVKGTGPIDDIAQRIVAVVGGCEAR